MHMHGVARYLDYPLRGGTFLINGKFLRRRVVHPETQFFMMTLCRLGTHSFR